MNVFIFQSVPERHDLRSAIEPGKRETWNATRYQREMHPGDLVLFWLAGEPDHRGLYGWGRIVSEPYLEKDWDSHGVDVIYKGKFHRPLLAHRLRQDDILSKMLIFRAPQATNFLLEESEVRRLFGWIEKSGEKIIQD